MDIDINIVQCNIAFDLEQAQFSLALTDAGIEDQAVLRLNAFADLFLRSQQALLALSLGRRRVLAWRNSRRLCEVLSDAAPSGGRREYCSTLVTVRHGGTFVTVLRLVQAWHQHAQMIHQT